MFLDANTAYENVSLKDLAPPPNQPLPYIRDVSKDKRSFTVMPRRIFSATHTHPDEPAIEEASSEMEVSDTGSIASIDSEILSISSLDSTTMEDVQQLENVEIETNQLYESSDESHISEVSTGSPSHIVEAVAPVAAIAPAINAFGPWFQPADQNFPTMVSDDTDDESDTDDELVIPSSTHIQMTSDYLIENTRAYCEVITSFTLARQVRTPFPNPKPQTDTHQLQINSPLLIVTKEDVYLYQRPLDYAGDHSDYIVTMRRPLHPNDLHIPCLFIPGSHDRHCYTTQIPELGVFIVASPNGRAGVFSLTRAPGHANPQASGRPQFGFQLEYILPFADRDGRKVWDVEGARLIGVAAGPVQGMLDSESGVGGEGGGGGLYEERRGKRRWRVLMYYTDHTVLAFELGRKRGGVDVDVEALVV
ncbi:hypothetical protein G6514_000768 [Epicoccum nigrum]|nr:hypothetical protein G6514_000768 [Epicoccum nigrum]